MFNKQQKEAHSCVIFFQKFTIVSKNLANMEKLLLGLLKYILHDYIHVHGYILVCINNWKIEKLTNPTNDFRKKVVKNYTDIMQISRESRKYLCSSETFKKIPAEIQNILENTFANAKYFRTYQ
jgi:hypothetical protein